MKKLLLFDIDGTLAVPGQGPSGATVDAIRGARKKGHLAFISTGRTFDSVPPAVAEIGFDGGVFSSGGITKLGDDVLAQQFMEERYVGSLIRLLSENGIFFALETPVGRIHSDNGELVLSRIDLDGLPEEMRRFTRNVIFDPTALPYSAYAGQPVYKIAYYSADPAVTDWLAARLRGSLNVVPFCDVPGFPLTFGEISDPTVTKGRAMGALCRHFQISPEDCIAFGDSMNDADMLQAAGLGVAMGNAVPELKALADRVCDSCENDGVAKTLRELGLI